EGSMHERALLLLRQRVENRAQLSADIPKDRFPPSFGHEYYVVLCSPTWSGLGFDKHLTLILLRVGHQATWGGSYSRNGQTYSSLTGRTSGLLFESKETGRRRQGSSR